MTQHDRPGDVLVALSQACRYSRSDVELDCYRRLYAAAARFIREQGGKTNLIQLEVGGVVVLSKHL